MLAPHLLHVRAKSTHSKAASTADTVGTAPQSHSVGAGPAICFDAGACELGARVGGVQRAGETSAPASPEGPGPSASQVFLSPAPAGAFRGAKGAACQVRLRVCASPRSLPPSSSRSPGLLARFVAVLFAPGPVSSLGSGFRVLQAWGLRGCQAAEGLECLAAPSLCRNPGPPPHRLTAQVLLRSCCGAIREAEERLGSAGTAAAPGGSRTAHSGQARLRFGRQVGS